MLAARQTTAKPTCSDRFTAELPVPEALNKHDLQSDNTGRKKTARSPLRPQTRAKTPPRESRSEPHTPLREWLNPSDAQCSCGRRGAPAESGRPPLGCTAR